MKHRLLWTKITLLRATERPPNSAAECSRSASAATIPTHWAQWKRLKRHGPMAASLVFKLIFNEQRPQRDGHSFRRCCHAGHDNSRRSLLDEKENNFFDRLDNFQFCRP